MPGFESLPIFNAEIKPQAGFQWNYVLRDHLGNTKILFADKNNDGMIKQDVLESLNEVLSVSNYSPFGLEMGGSHQNLKHQYDYKFNGKENNGFSGLTYFGGRWLGTGLSKWTTFDPLGEKFYPSTLNSFAVNSPIMLNDPSGKDWSISASRDENGNWQINITVNAAVLNSSSNHFDMRSYMANEKANFSRIFSKKGDGFEVKASLNLRPVIDKSQVKDSEHLINIQNPENFKGDANSYEAGSSYKGGLLVNINSRSINNDGSSSSNATLSHELGHTGGLKHPFDDAKYGYFVNGSKVEFGNQILGTSLLYNFMSYPKDNYSKMLSDYSKVINSIYQTPGAATRNQLAFILRMYSSKTLNFNNK